MYSVTGSHSCWVAACLVCLLAANSKGEILDVPEEYTAIQEALSATATGDTVRVAPGRYHEFLTCSTDGLVLLGQHSSDTLPELWTILDPIPGEIDTPSTLVLTGDSATVQNLVLFNRLELRQPEWATRTGGILFSGETLNIMNCRFDSVSVAVEGGNDVNVKNSVFIGCQWQCIRPASFGSLTADSCFFDGEGNWLVRCYSSSSIRNCTFLCSATHNDLLSFAGENIEVIGCRFGPCYSAFPVLRATTMGNCRIEGCVFEDIERASALIEVSMDCRTDEGVPVTIRGNRFQNYQGIPPANGTNAISLICQGFEHGYFGLIEDNIFEDGFSISAPGVNISGSVDIVHNSFTNLQPDSLADVKASQRDFDTIRARDNQFYEPGIAAISGGAYFDASENWWGDSTGPFHPSLNPDGLGTEVGNGVIFEPWLTVHPDSADSNSSSIEQPVLLPNEYSLSAYPNPFNATTTLSIQVSRPGVYDLILYDVTGRETAKLFNGRIVAAHDVQINADKFATGIYFARLVGEERELAVVKLVLLK
ncbi:T9SS type A sorting domain-containing protein [bacterium]|nr:T9SS type A sorting domain-containing protein [bacterium]